MDLTLFKKEFIPQLLELKYKIQNSKFENGDFGNLERVEFEGHNKVGNIDFWSLGWLNIHLVNYQNGEELINIMLEPTQNNEKDHYFLELKRILLE